MGFVITSGNENDKMYPGQIITYIVKPIPGIPMRWVTEISHVNEPHYFVDEQRFGPYSFWHHQHHLRSVEGGVLMEDIVHYRIPLGWIGNLMNRLFIRPQLEKIFAFRKNKLEQLFPKAD